MGKNFLQSRTSQEANLLATVKQVCQLAVIKRQKMKVKKKGKTLELFEKWKNTTIPSLQKLSIIWTQRKTADQRNFVPTYNLP